ncbi:MAG: TlyA family RNA methyltransferase [Clostridia bacterium]|nr:TlyA family RNA methyltransferase [Clostridia bacterium]
MTRIDIELVNRNLIESRAKAQDAIKGGLIYCNGKLITKCSLNVSEVDIIEIKGELLKYVSRGGLKLEKALQEFGIDLHDKVMCDIGSSTGGFSDCAIQNGIKEIYAIDVGRNQFDNRLQKKANIHLYENTDFRKMENKLLEAVNIVTIDVSFISVTKLIDKIADLPNVKEIVCLVKPQFECGKENADRYKGIILDKQIHYEVIKKLISKFSSVGFCVSGLTYSPIKGGSGNIEYLMYLKENSASDSAKNINIQKVVKDAFSNMH